MDSFRLQSTGQDIVAGGELARGKPALNGTLSTGTASLIVSDASGTYAMTCAHVLKTKAILNKANSDLVYSPHYKNCGDIDCNSPFGIVVDATLLVQNDERTQVTIDIDGHTYAVDAALIKLQAGASWSNEVPKIGMIAGVRNLIAELGPGSFVQDTTDPQNPVFPMKKPDGTPLAINVEKYGSTTKHSKGVASRLRTVTCNTFADGATDVQGWVFEIDAAPDGSGPVEYPLDMARNAGQLFFDKPQEIASAINKPGNPITATIGGTADAPTLILTGSNFSAHGDSGAPIVDGSKKIIGILLGGTVQPVFIQGEAEPIEIRTGRSCGVFIQAALNALGVTFSPGKSNEGPARAVPGMPVAVTRDVVDLAAAERARVAIAATPVGARLAELLRLHLTAIRYLVHHRRRVTVAWHRNKGPAFLAAILRGSHEPGWPIPAEIEGVKLVDTLRVMRDVITAEADPVLAGALRDHEADVLALAPHATSVDALLAHLRATGATA